MKIFELGGVKFSAIPYSIGLFPGHFFVPLNQGLLLVVSERRNPEWQSKHRMEISGRIGQALDQATLHQILQQYKVQDLGEIKYVAQAIDCTEGLSYLMDGRPLWFTVTVQYKDTRRCVIFKEETPLLL